MNQWDYTQRVNSALEGCESTTAIRVCVDLALALIEAATHRGRAEAMQTLVALVQSAHSWVGTIGTPWAHCMRCRRAHTTDTALEPCEGTCICANCGHHIDAHSIVGEFARVSDTTAHCHATPENTSGVTTPCTCKKFERGVAVLTDGRGWVLKEKTA